MSNNTNFNGDKNKIVKFSPCTEYLNNARNDVIKCFSEIVSKESPSQNKKLNDALADYLQNLFKYVAKVDRIPQEKVGDNLRIEYGSGEQQVLLLCHMDTVWDEGEIKKRPFQHIGNKLIGPGTFDMKFGIVQTYYAIKAILDNNIPLNYRIVVYINSDEETGSRYSEKFIAEEAKKSKCVLVMEPSEPTGYAKTSRKGMSNYKLKVHGKAAHAGAYHQDGISAVKELSKLILKIEDLTDYEQNITSNVGIISGGSRTNVIPDYAEASMEFRFATKKQSDKIHTFMAELKPFTQGASIEVIQESSKAPFEKNEGNHRLYQYVKNAAHKLDLPMGEIFAGGLSDGNITSGLGIPTVDGLGPIGSGSHSLDEYVDEPSIIDRIRLLVTLLQELNSF